MGKEAQPVGRDPQLSRRALWQIPAGGRGRAPRSAALDHLRQPEGQRLSRPLSVLRIFAKPPGDPAVLAFLKGRIDNNLAIVDKRLARAVRRWARTDHRRPFARRLSLLSGEEFGFDIRRSTSEHRGSIASRRCRAGSTLRPHAGPSAAVRECGDAEERASPAAPRAASRHAGGSRSEPARAPWHRCHKLGAWQEPM